MPPSTSNDWPVMNDDSSEARNSAPLAISSGLAEAPHRDVHQPALALVLVVQVLGQQRREHRSGAQRVGPQALAGVDDGDLPGHRQHRPLGGRVGDLGGGGPQVGHEAGHVDDGRSRPATGGLVRRHGGEHGRDAVLAAQGHARDVDVERQVPHVGAGVGRHRRRPPGRRRRCCRARGGRRTADVAKSTAARDRLLVGHVGGHVGGPAPAGGDGLHHVGAVAQVGDHHVGPLGREQLGGHPAQARRGPGDQCDLAVQSSHCVLRSVGGGRGAP